MVASATKQVHEQQQYAIKYILPKCIIFLNMYSNSMQNMEHIKFNKNVYLRLFPKCYHEFSWNVTMNSVEISYCSLAALKHFQIIYYA
jgi:hypothetical protein